MRFSPRLYAPGSRSRERLRRMYPGGRADAAARRGAVRARRLIRLGLLPRRWVVLEVPGRRTGRPMRIPVGVVHSAGASYLVSMLGDVDWPRNVRAAQGAAVLLRIRRHEVTLTEVPATDRAPIIRDYLNQVPGGRPHVPVEVGAPLADFERIAADYPVFRIAAAAG